MKGLVVALVIFHVILQILIDREATFIADPLLKAIQGFSLYSNQFRSEEILYIGKWADSNFSSFVFDSGFSFMVNGKYIGVFPLIFSLYSGLILKIGIQSIPFFAFLFIVWAFYIIHKKLEIPILFCFLYFFSSILNNSVFDLNENPIYFFLNVAGFSFFIIYLKYSKSINLGLGILLISIAVWFRLESLLFLISCSLASFYFLIKDKEKDFIKAIIVSIIFAFPVYLFLFWNYWDYGHVLGPRFTYNFATHTTILERIVRIISMSLIYKDQTGIKLGLFICSPFLLLSLIYFLRNFKSQNNIAVFSFLVFLTQFVLVSLTAPNDGVTLTARYHLLSIIPGIVLSYNAFISTKTKLELFLTKASYGIAILLGLFFSIGWVLFAKEIKKFQKIAIQEETNVYIAKSEILCASFGLEHLKKSIYCVKNEEAEKSILDKIFANQEMKLVKYILEYKEKDLNKIKPQIEQKFQNGNFQLKNTENYKSAYVLTFLRD